MPRKLSKHLLDFYKLNPQNFTSIDNTEYANADGFADYCSSVENCRNLPIEIKNNEIYAFGQKIKYLVDFDHDGRLKDLDFFDRINKDEILLTVVVFNSSTPNTRNGIAYAVTSDNEKYRVFDRP